MMEQMSNSLKRTEEYLYIPKQEFVGRLITWLGYEKM